MAREERRRAAALGARAEARVSRALAQRGYQILGRNVRVGRQEIDILARRGRTVVVVEVRARRSAAFVSPLATIGPGKIARLRRAAAAWLHAHGRPGDTLRFDAAAVTYEDGPPGRLDYREDAF